MKKLLYKIFILGSLWSRFQEKSNRTGIMYAPVSLKNLNEVQRDSKKTSFSRTMGQYLSRPSFLGEKVHQKSSFYSDYQNLPSPEVLKRLFNLYSEVTSEMGFGDQIRLQNVFFSKEYRKVLQVGNIVKLASRQNPRLLSKCHGLALLEDSEEKIYTVNVSKTGLRFVSNHKFQTGDYVSMVLKVGDKKRVMIDVDILWSNGKGEFGAQFEGVPSTLWLEFIVNLTSRMGFENKRELVGIQKVS